MARLEELTKGSRVRGVLPNETVTIVEATWLGEVALDITYQRENGRRDGDLLYRDREPDLDIQDQGPAWSFDGDGEKLRLVSEAHRIRLAHLFDPLLAVHSSVVDPLPHQITAVYEEMLPRQPLRFLLADDPGAGKTIMAGLLIKELKVRADLQRCLIVCPGNLVDQWQDEMWDRFHLDFKIISNQTIEESRTGNPYSEIPLVISRLDHMARNEHIQDKLLQTEWDLVVVDEAHKMSAHFFSGEIKETKRFKLGKLLGSADRTRHFLLITATPHNGKEEDYQLFMSLLDSDRFEGRFRDGVHTTDTSDLMRRMAKESLLKFDGTKLFPERIANTVNYTLSDTEAQLYAEVTDYVTDEMNRADRLAEEGEGRRKNRVGFALTTLQRRLASSPEAIYQSLLRRREKLGNRLQEEKLLKGGDDAKIREEDSLPVCSIEDLEDLADSTEDEVTEIENKIVEQASAAQTIAELEAEIGTLKRLEQLAFEVRQSKCDKKWEQLSRLLQEEKEMFDPRGNRRKLIIFTEHRDTLNYLQDNISTILGRSDAVVVIHGSIGREDRRKVQEAFSQDRDVQILVATDAAGEGVNLQRAHLIINYDLPWNPNRLEQRFGRIHRIGQTEVCHMWNLVACETREGSVFDRLFEKLETERKSLGGGVFDVLGKVFEGADLRELLINAIRYGDDPKTKEELEKKIEGALDHEALRALLEEQALATEAMSVSRVQKIREQMERAEARKLQPHFVRSFFLEAFTLLGGTIREREPKRYEIANVPAQIRNRDRQIGRGAPVQIRYERVCFEKELVTQPGKSPASLICPGHPLLDSVIDLILERYRNLLRSGAILVDDSDERTESRVLFYLEHSIQDARINADGNRRLISKRLQFIEIDREHNVCTAGYAPYLNYRPATADEAKAIEPLLGEKWLREDLDPAIKTHAVEHLVPEHLDEVRTRKETLVQKTMKAVEDRLTKEIYFWDKRAKELKELELAGKSPGELNSGKARQRADDLRSRLKQRTEELEQERKISPAPPVVIGGTLVIPKGFFRSKKDLGKVDTFAIETEESEKKAMDATMAMEEYLGFEPTDRSREKCGYDIESRDPNTGNLRFIEVKGRNAHADTITVSKNEILTCLNKPDSFILAIGLNDGEKVELRYLRAPFQNEPDFSVTSVNYNLQKLWSMAEVPS